MKRIIVFSSSFLLSVGVFAQTTYYVEPTIQAKYGVISANPTNSSSVETGRLYDLDCPSISTPLFGLNLGLSLNGGRQNVVFGVNNDRSEFGYYYGVWDPSVGLTQRSVNNIKVNYTNLRLTFEQRLLTPSNTNLYAVVGVGGTFNNRNQTKNINNPNSPMDADRYSLVRVSEEITRTSSNKVVFSPSITFGLKSDFYTKKGTYLFSSAALVTFGLTDISTITVNTNRVLDGENYSNVATASSRGSGVYLQLSRKINFKPAK